MLDPNVAWDAGRICDYCGEKFHAKRPADTRQRFCKANCRKNFFRYGAKQRIVAAISRDFNRQVDSLRNEIQLLAKRIAALEKPLTKHLG